MKVNDGHLASRDDFVHRYSEAGFAPAQVGAAIREFTDALGIAPRNGDIYLMHAVEIASFERYLNRTLVPEAPEVHDMRCGAILRTVAETMNNWGDTAQYVTFRLGLDTMPPKDFADIARLVETTLAGFIVASAISFEVDGVRVDGVLVEYPQPVGAALATASLDATRQAARQPF